MKQSIVIVCLAWAASAQAALSWEALPKAVAEAPAAEAQRREVVAAQDRVSPAWRSFGPRLEAYGGLHSESWQPGGEASGPQAGAKGSLNLWRFGRDRARSSQLGSEARAAGARASLRQRDLLFEARETWLAAWAARQRLASTRAALERCQEDLKRVRRQASAGMAPRSDVLALEVLLEELDQHAFEEGHLADEAEHHVAALLGLEPRQAEGLAEGQSMDWPVASSDATAMRGEQDLLEAEIQALEAQARALGGALQPSLDLEAQTGYGRGGLGLRDARDLRALGALSLAWDPAAARGQEQDWLGGQAQAKRHALQARQKADAVEREELGHALTSWVSRRETVEKRLKATESYRRAVIEENSRGLRDSRDLAESNEALLEAEEDRIVAQVTAWGVWAELQAFGAKP